MSGSQVNARRSHTKARSDSVDQTAALFIRAGRFFAPVLDVGLIGAAAAARLRRARAARLDLHVGVHACGFKRGLRLRDVSGVSADRLQASEQAAESPRVVRPRAPSPLRKTTRHNDHDVRISAALRDL